MYKFDALGQGGISNMMKGFPKVILAMFGMVPGLDLDTAEGFFGMLYTYVLIMAGIYAVTLSSGIISKEERNRTTEFLMAKPVTRSSVLAQKLLAVLINTVIFDAVFWLFSIAVMKKYSGIYILEDTNQILSISDNFGAHLALLTLGLLLFQLIYIGIGMIFAASFKDSGRSGTFSIIILLVTYLLFIVTGIVENNSVIRFFTPFAYFLPSDLTGGGGLGWIYAILCIIIFLVLTFFAFKAYKSRDLYCI
jgi:ABC-2 type transport system permease protein